MTAYLDQIERLNPQVNAIVSLRRPLDCAAPRGGPSATRRSGAASRRAGCTACRSRSRTCYRPAASIRTTWGSPLFAEFVPDTRREIAVERMRRAGAIVIGKTQRPRVSASARRPTTRRVRHHAQRVRNPARTAGGSSGGAAVALALRMLPVADGSDHAGSLRNPRPRSTTCSGSAPTFGSRAVRRGRCLPYPALGVIGPMARTATDLALTALGARRPRSARAACEPRRAGPVRRDRSESRPSPAPGSAGSATLGGHMPFEPGVLELAQLRPARVRGESAAPSTRSASITRWNGLWQSWLVASARTQGRLGAQGPQRRSGPVRADQARGATGRFERGARLYRL